MRQLPSCPMDDKLFGILQFCVPNQDVSVCCFRTDVTELAEPQLRQCRCSASPTSNSKAFGAKSELTDKPQEGRKETVQSGESTRKLAVIHLRSRRTRPSSCGAFHCLAFCCFLLHEGQSKEHFHFPPRRLLC